jgi:tRNA modification GTPase
MSLENTDTICAIATATGRGGIGIIRVSGPKTKEISLEILGFEATPRHAHSTNFLNHDQSIIDSGIAIYYVAPNSFTGEDILELQGHGGSQIMHTVLDRVIALGARQSHPGEFSERAFLNNKIDLVQAEAIADLIDASSKQAARSAMRTLQGEFSKRINELQSQLTATRVNVEAAIDFSDEDIDVLSDTGVSSAIDNTLNELAKVFAEAEQGVILREGMNVVIAGKPNAGKSSLLNALAGEESAIVTDIPGTTRDLLRIEITIEGMPVHVIDTAGLRESDDVVEKEGIKRAKQAIEQADQVLLVIDESHSEQDVSTLLTPFQNSSGELSLTREQLKNVTLIFNKIDLVNDAVAKHCSLTIADNSFQKIRLSAKTGEGIDLLRTHLQQIIGYQPSESGSFVARARHLSSLTAAKNSIISAAYNLSKHSPLELIAEDLRLAQQALAAITGEISSDDLLGEIFSNFCVGK